MKVILKCKIYANKLQNGCRSICNFFLALGNTGTTVLTFQYNKKQFGESFWNIWNIKNWSNIRILKTSRLVKY